MSPKTANKRSAILQDATNNASAATCAEDAMETTATIIQANAESETGAQLLPAVSVGDELTVAEPEREAAVDGRPGHGATSDAEPDAANGEDASAAHDLVDAAIDDSNELSDSNAPVPCSGTPDDSVPSAREDDIVARDAPGVTLDSPRLPSADVHDSNFDATADHVESSSTASEPSASSLPDPTSISARLKSLVVAVSRVEELSRHAREVAASDMALYDGIAASQRQFEEGLAEAKRTGQEAQAVYERAFGREARALAEPAVMEAREVEQAFKELANAWRQQAEAFLSEHPDVESLLAEQRQHDDEARRREAARAKAQRFQELVTTTDAALRQGLLDEAKDCLGMLAREFPAEVSRIAPLQERLQHKVRAANDAAARRTLFQASELQGRGDFDAAVRLLEAVEISGLSRESARTSSANGRPPAVSSGRLATWNSSDRRRPRVGASSSIATQASHTDWSCSRLSAWVPRTPRVVS